MDDSELFAVFVADVVNGTESLASNPNYRIESVLGTLQLVDNKAGVIATGKSENGQPQIMVKRYCDAWESLRQALTHGSFFPDVAQNKAQLVPFTRATIPEGYQLYDCAASEMWRSWRRGAVDHVHIYTANHWRSVGEISCSGGVVFIPVPDLEKEIQMTSSSLMSWLGVPNV
ncbi:MULTISPECIES: hypothetical protein [unclassified Thermosynechococcus]|uniref:hypothetical protein n=1 Tax=unclassified Thermosynechococcus TaxID=2622553 RepID=UPI0019DA5256|nr:MULTISPECIES: hypothetical protein [unclassified Thermosynechococcus]HIK35658.1 hypothetical protein [Thermosynechococcus sp. M98_K2018_005]HIK48861.1 hypothetical protein [Thermosynechococcus sp. M55_K2018_012]